MNLGTWGLIVAVIAAAAWLCLYSDWMEDRLPPERPYEDWED